MKTITLQEAINILQNSSAVLFDHTLAFGHFGEEADEFFFEVSFEEGFQDFLFSFLEKDNQEVSVVGASIFLIDADGNEWEITPLFQKEL
jgi:hypothetical protein